MAQKQGFDYNLAGSGVQFVSGNPPQPGDTLLAWYRAPSIANGGVQGGNLQGAPGPATMSTQVICGINGTQTSAVTLTSLGSCTIPASFLGPGDRVEIHFLFAHTGIGAGFTYLISWGGTTMMQRVAGAADAAISGRSEASITAGPTQISGESYGTVLPLATVLTSSTVSNATAIQITFQAALSAAVADTIGLANATVIRYPAISNP